MRRRRKTAGSDVIKLSTDDGSISITRERDRIALIYDGADGACADKFSALLAPHPARARVHPHGASAIVVQGPTHDGGIAVSGK